MDTSGFSQVGRYGTISLLKRLETDTVVTSFGIDSEQITFGTARDCSVRLYYPDVSNVHCKIMFEERKAFLVVLGSSGLLVDGCQVFPKHSTSSPTTIALSNNSEIEIHKKRFRFTYPPKDLREQLFATPPRSDRRGPRLSMIQSAQVFSPRPFSDPRENLRVLQSPLKPFRPLTPVRVPLPESPNEEDDEEEEIVLVEGNHPRVVEEEKDLVILEHVEAPTQSLTLASQQLPLNPPRLPPQTPQRRVRPSLHKAVLLRSAHKAFERAEAEKREEEEEMEVFGTVLTEEDSEQSESDEGTDDEPDAGQDSDGEQDDEDMNVQNMDEDDENDQEENKSTWRQSLERIWPFRASTSPERTEANQDTPDAPTRSISMPTAVVMPPSQVKEEDEAETIPEPGDSEEDEEVADLPPAPTTPIRRNLFGTRFMTPQLERSKVAAMPRFSVGGSLPQRVTLEQPWKVSDIIVPPVDAPPSTPNAQRADSAKPRESISAEERKAIQERRRSVLMTPDMFFAGAAPGMSPSKTRAAGGSSPEKPKNSSVDKLDEEEDMDTRNMLERMKQTVEDMKRRNSIHPREANVNFLVLDETMKQEEDQSNAADGDKAALVLLREGVDESTAVLTTPPKRVNPRTPSIVPESVEEFVDEEPEVDSHAQETKSAMLRKKGRQARPKETPSLADDEASPDTVGHTHDDSDDEEKPPVRTRARLLRAKPPSKDEHSAVTEASKSTTRSRSTRAKPAPIDASTSNLRPRSGQKAAAASVEPEDIIQLPQSKVPARRGRNASAESNAEPAKPARRGRPPKNTASESESETGAPARPRRGRPPKVAEPPNGIENVAEEEVTTGKKRGTKAATKIKEEEMPVVETAKPAARTTRRGKKALEAEKTAAEQFVDERGKENAPGSTSDEDVIHVKTRARRGVPNVKQEVLTEPELRPTRMTRVTRTRTRTHE